MGYVYSNNTQQSGDRRMLNHTMKARSGVETSMGNTWMGYFGRHRPLVRSALTCIAAVLAVLSLCSCCCIPCQMVSRIVNKAVAANRGQYVEVPLDEDKMEENYSCVIIFISSLCVIKIYLSCVMCHKVSNLQDVC